MLLTIRLIINVKNIKTVKASAASAWTLVMLSIRGSGPQTNPKDLERFTYPGFVECG